MRFRGMLNHKKLGYACLCCQCILFQGYGACVFGGRLGISTGKVIAVGDHWNDLPMIERAGLGFAVNNANDRLKQKAIVLKCSNNEGAIAELIEKYAYSK